MDYNKLIKDFHPPKAKIDYLSFNVPPLIWNNLGSGSEAENDFGKELSKYGDGVAPIKPDRMRLVIGCGDPLGFPGPFRELVFGVGDPLGFPGPFRELVFGVVIRLGFQDHSES